MSDFREDDQAGNDVMQAFWNSPLGKEWIKESKEAQDKLPKGSAKVVWLNVENINLERFEDD